VRAARKSGGSPRHDVRSLEPILKQALPLTLALAAFGLLGSALPALAATDVPAHRVSLRGFVGTNGAAPTAGGELAYRLISFEERVDVTLGAEPISFATPQSYLVTVGGRYYGDRFAGNFRPYGLAKVGPQMNAPVQGGIALAAYAGGGIECMATETLGYFASVDVGIPSGFQSELGLKLAF
jgi:hypothetical protein